MSDDSKTRLTQLADRLTSIVLEEADPDNWPGAGKKISDLTKAERGDRYWDKKNAAGTMTLLVKVHSLIGMHRRGDKPGEHPSTSEEDFELGQQISKAEREAAAILERIQKQSKK